VFCLLSCGLLLKSDRIDFQEGAFDFDAVYANAGRNNSYMNLGLYNNSGNCNVSFISTHLEVAQYTNSRPSDAWQACGQNLARRLAQAVQMGRKDHLVDVGFGRGVQDILFLTEFDPASIAAYNIGEEQTKLAKALLQSLPSEFGKRLRFNVGSATQLPAGNCTATKITSLENAFHYQLREDFFDEAYRVLCPGGILGLMDIVATPEYAAVVSNVLNGSPESARGGFWPRGNFAYASDEYKVKLQQSGFVAASIEDISEEIVLWNNHVARALHLDDLWSKNGDDDWIFQSGESRFDLEGKVREAHKYVLVTARKPVHVPRWNTEL